MSKIHTTNYRNTLIKIAEDCKVTKAKMPPTKEDKKTIANMQFDIIYNHPYQFTSDEVIFNIYAERQTIRKDDLVNAKSIFFSKGQACLRTSALCKQYGWGIHHNNDNKIALVAMESELYKSLAVDETIQKVNAMKSNK